MTYSQLPETFRSLGGASAIANLASYAELASICDEKLGAIDIPAGSVVALAGDYDVDTVSWQFALQAHGCIVIPIGPTWAYRIDSVLELTQAEFLVDSGSFSRLQRRTAHPIYQELRQRGNPGLVLLTSGTTGEPKVVVHDAAKMLDKIAMPGRTHRTVGFLSFDHIGGQNTMLYCLVHGGCLIPLPNRQPETVCEEIERHRAELLPVSPSFLRILLLSGAVDDFDLSSLKLIAYGSEPMPEATLEALDEAFPNVAKLQQYGMSELGVLRSRSRSDDSAWIKLGGPEFEVRVNDGRLEIKAETAMLGYLNAESPFTGDGWLKTGDIAEQDGEWIRILGRGSDVVNVGGEKVYPTEVESVIEEMQGVLHAVVRKEPNPILGHVVAVQVRLSTNETIQDFRPRMRAFCASRLARHMVPQKVEITVNDLTGIKKSRSA